MLKKNYFLHHRFFKVFCGLLLIIFFLSLVDCSGPGRQPLRTWMSDSNQIKVLSSVKQIGDLVADIGGERVDSWVLIRGLDPHHYELVKGDGELLEHADLIFYNGLGLEHGASLFSWLHSSGKSVAIGDRIQEQFPDRILYKGPAADPHIWMDVSIWAIACDVICEKLADLDPDGSSYYSERARLLKNRMEEIHSEIQETVHRIPADRRYFVTSHDAFEYFTRSYLAEMDELDWPRRCAAPEGLAPDGQLSPVDIQRMIDFLIRHNISILFTESNVSPDSLNKIADAGTKLGLRVQICKEALFGDAIDQDLHYLDMMRHNAKVIAGYLDHHESD
jgi:manganese/zinc/iron transport system substrate-binding protein